MHRSTAAPTVINHHWLRQQSVLVWCRHHQGKGRGLAEKIKFHNINLLRWRTSFYKFTCNLWFIYICKDTVSQAGLMLCVQIKTQFFLYVRNPHQETIFQWIHPLSFNKLICIIESQWICIVDQVYKAVQIYLYLMPFEHIVACFFCKQKKNTEKPPPHPNCFYWRTHKCNSP